MNLDLHVPRFTWPDTPAATGPTLTALAQTAESIGVRTQGQPPQPWLEEQWTPVMERLASI